MRASSQLAEKQRYFVLFNKHQYVKLVGVVSGKVARMYFYFEATPKLVVLGPMVICRRLTIKSATGMRS